MKVVLLTDVPKLGQKYDVKEVADGYAQNFLIPNKKATLATANKEKEIEKLQVKAEGERKVQEELLLKDFESLEKASVTIKRKVNEQGHLFEGVHAHEIVEALAEQAHINLREDMITLKDAIKSAGEHTVPVTVMNKEGSIKVVIEPTED